MANPDMPGWARASDTSTPPDDRPRVVPTSKAAGWITLRYAPRDPPPPQDRRTDR